MKNLTMYALVLGMSTTLSFGTGTTTCTGLPTSQNQTNNEIRNNSAATDIISLSGTDCAGNAVNQFKIIKLPDSNSGILYMANGQPVKVGQTLTREEADGLKFDPAEGFTGDASFTYVAVDDEGESNEATLTLPIVASGNGGNGNGGNGGNGNGGAHPGGGNGGAHPGGGNGGAHPGGGTGNCTEPTTEDLTNPSLQNTLPAVNILNLAGHDCDGHNIERFEIVTLPAPESGTLYMADGVTEVTVGQQLTRAEADGLRFDPAPDFVGNAVFTYVAIDENTTTQDQTPATVTIPVVANGGNCTCEDYESDIPSNTPFGLLLMFLATLFIARKSSK